MLPGTNHARAIARSGVDWICVDTEHGNINDSQMHEAVTAIALAGVSPLVRIAANEPWMVKRKSKKKKRSFPELASPKGQKKEKSQF
jgi:4-hydroxy-2-oxoheptanedioate aldolase